MPYKNPEKATQASARYQNRNRVDSAWRKHRAGLARKDYQKNFLTNPARRVSMYRRSAKKRGLEFSISIEDIKRFWQKPCFYCDVEIKTIGLDRIENKLGYTPSNIISCCRRCNIARNNQTQGEFIEMCAKIARKHCAEVTNG